MKAQTRKIVYISRPASTAPRGCHGVYRIDSGRAFVGLVLALIALTPARAGYMDGNALLEACTNQTRFFEPIGMLQPPLSSAHPPEFVAMTGHIEH
jgi:hypothetical protein